MILNLKIKRFEKDKVNPYLLDIKILNVTVFMHSNPDVGIYK